MFEGEQEVGLNNGGGIFVLKFFVLELGNLDNRNGAALNNGNWFGSGLQQQWVSTMAVGCSGLNNRLRLGFIYRLKFDRPKLKPNRTIGKKI